MQIPPKKSVLSTKGQHTGICGLRTQRRPHTDHWPSIQWRHLGKPCNVWLPQCPSYSINAMVHFGKQRLSKPRERPPIVSPLPEQDDDLRFCLLCEKCEWWGRYERAPVNVLKESFADEEACGDRYRIEHAGRWLDQRVAILADQPLCSDELDEQLSSLLCQYKQYFQPQLATALAAEIRPCSLRPWRSTSMLRYPRPAQLLRFLKSTV